jgi:hypothetical protein
MAKDDRNMPAQQGNRDEMDTGSDERMRGTEDVRGIADEIADESEEEVDDSEDPDEEEEEDEGSF